MFVFQIPERTAMGFVYVWHRPNMNLSAAGVGVWDPVGDEPHNCLYYDFDGHQALPPDADMFDFELVGGLSMKLITPLQSYEMSYRGDGCELDLRWDGVIPVQEFTWAGEASVDAWGEIHHEQTGRARGTVTIEGESFVIDCLSLRDRSWGPRLPHKTWPRGAFEEGYASESHGFAVTPVSPLAFEDDPILGTTERIVYGWHVRDGILSRVASGERRVIERGADGRPLRIVIDAQDELGRPLHAEGRLENVLLFSAAWFVFWGLVRWELDGEEAWGHTQDLFRRRHIRNLQRRNLLARR
jgi:hypothetical protein